MSLIGELKRRNVFRVAVLYLVASWVILQVADVLFPALGVPAGGINLILGVLILGFPLVLIFSWVYELTPDGLKREKDIDRSQSVTSVTGQKINVLIVVLLIVAIAVVAIDRLLPASRQAADTSGTVVSSEQAAADAAADSGAPSTPTTPDDIAAGKFLNTAPEQSVAVLPFVNMSGDPQNEYFSDGLSEELLNALAGIKGLFVAARTSSFYFKGHTGDVADIARQLRVRNILEGSVRKAGERVRITAQLIDATNGYHLWSETFDRQLDDVFAVQDEISRKVAGALRVTLMTAGDAPIEKPTENMEAYLAYLRGQQQLHAGGVAGFQQAIGAFEEAVALDPNFAEAYAGIARAWAAQLDWGNITQEEAAGPAKAAADRAMALDPDLPMALTAQALAFLTSGPRNGVDPRTLQSLEQALSLDPENVDILGWYASALQSADRPEEAVAALERGLSRDPLSANLQMELGRALMSLRRRDAARQHFLSAMELAPDHPSPPDGIAFLERGLGRFDEAIQWQDQVIQRDPADAFSRMMIASDYLDLNDPDRAAQWLAVAESMPGRQTTVLAARSVTSYLKGDKAGAVAAAEKAYGQVSDGSGAPGFSAHILYRYLVAKGDFDGAIRARFGSDGLPAVPARGEQVPTSRVFDVASASVLVAARDGEEAGRRYAREVLGWVDSIDWPDHQRRNADLVRCAAYARLEQSATAVTACRSALEQNQQWQMVYWQIIPELDPIRDTPEWQGFTAEIRADRAEQLARFRASGKEPEPH